MSGGAAFSREGAKKLVSPFRGQKKLPSTFKGGKKIFKSSYSSYSNPNSTDICFALIDMYIVPLYCGYIVVILSLCMVTKSINS